MQEQAQPEEEEVAESEADALDDGLGVVDERVAQGRASRVASIAVRSVTILRPRVTKVEMRQRRAQASQQSSASVPGRSR